jgi:Leucine-rich repeat (LRR) protein
MKLLGRGEQKGDLLPQMTDDPCGPFREEPVYFDPSTGQNVVYDIQSHHPVEEVLFRCAGAKRMHMEVLDLEGKVLSQVGPIDGGDPRDGFYLLIPGGAPTRFRLRLHSEASQWFFIAALRLRSHDAAGAISDSARQTPIPDPQSPIPVSFEQAEELQQTWAKRVGAAVQWSNSIGMKFALVPPGSFEGGELAEPYYLGIYKVTQEEYQRIMGANPSAYSATGDKKGEVAGKDTRRFPVENICWIDAAEFCNRLSEKEGLKPYYRIDGDTVRCTGARGYCLPCRTACCYAAYAAETQHPVVDVTQADEYSWGGWDNGPPHPVGAKKPTAFGLYDMFGNGEEYVLALGMGNFIRGNYSLQSLHGKRAFPPPWWGKLDWLYGFGPRGRGPGFRVMRVLDRQLAPALPADRYDTAERAVAEWALGLGRGGRVSLCLDGNEWGISSRDEFPQERVRVARLDLNGVAVVDSDLDRLRRLKGLREFVCDSPHLGDAGMARLSMLLSLQNLFLGGVRLTDAGLAHLARLPHIRKLDVGSQLLSDAGVSSVGKMVTLEELRLNHGVNITDAALPHLGKLVALKKLDVEGSKVTGDGLKYLANLHSLEELGVSGTRFSDQGAGLLEQFPALRVLDVRDTSCSDQALLHIGQLTHLRVLWLGGTQVTGDGLKHLAKLTSLEELTLFRTRFSDRGAKNLEQLPALRVLNVGSTPCSDQAMPHIGQLKNLRALYLGGSQVTSDGLRHLANLSGLEELVLDPIPRFDSREAGLAGLTRLRRLVLSGTPVDDDQLAELPRWKGLRELILARTGITDAGLDTLTKITKLEHLDLGGTKVTAAGVARLHAALPRCKISGAPAPAKN